MKLRCSKCRQAWIDTNVGRCDACGLVLGEAADIVVPSSLGALDSDSAEEVELDAEMDAATTPAPVSITGITGASSLRHHGVPERIPQQGVADVQLTPFEGYLLSLVDGATFVDDVIAASGLQLHEAAIALQNLKLKGLIRFRDSVDQDAARRAVDGGLRPEEPPSAAAAAPSLGRVGLKKLAMGTVAPVENPAEQLHIAREEAARGNFVQAREHARLAAMIAPDNTDATFLLEQLESPAHAKTRAKHLHNLGSACQKANDNMGAVEFFRRALQEWEPSAVIHHKLAVSLALAGFPLTEAEQHLSRACMLAPTNQTYLTHLSQLRAQLYGSSPPAPRF